MNFSHQSPFFLSLKKLEKSKKYIGLAEVDGQHPFAFPKFKEVCCQTVRHPDPVQRREMDLIQPLQKRPHRLSVFGLECLRIQVARGAHDARLSGRLQCRFRHGIFLLQSLNQQVHGPRAIAHADVVRMGRDPDDPRTGKGAKVLILELDLNVRPERD